ncbi:MAG: extracellular solute-binding protein [Dehalococcoidales bacterium]|nr:extracellular solute-binding protein [Dehalococcoidales bacterium]
MASRRQFLRGSVSLLTATVFLHLLQACGTPQGTSSGATPKSAATLTPPSQTGAQATQAPSKASAATAETKIAFWALSTGSLNEALQGAVDQFVAQNPDVQVEVNCMGVAEFYQKVPVAFMGGIAPEVLWLGYGQVGTYQASKWLAPIDDVIRPWPDIDDFEKFSIDWSLVNGRPYGVLFGNPYPFYLRADWYREAGLDPDAPPKNWDEVRATARRLVKRDGGRVMRGGVEVPTKNGDQGLASWAWTHGAKNFYDAEGMPLYTSKEVVETLEFLVSMVHDEKLTVPSEAVTAAGTALRQGLAAQGFDASTALPGLSQAAGSSAVRLALPPANPETKALMLGSAFCLSSQISSSKKSGAAVRLFKHLCSPESAWSIHMANSHIPPRKSLRDRLAKANPQNPTLLRVFENAYGWPLFGNFVQSRQILIDNLDAIYLGQVSAKEGLARAAEETKKLPKM